MGSQRPSSLRVTADNLHDRGIGFALQPFGPVRYLQDQRTLTG